MKRVWLLAVWLVAMWGLCGEVSAQGFFCGNVRTGYPSVPCAGGSSGIGMPTVYIGWLQSPQESKWALLRVGGSGTAPWPLKGLWLAATKDFIGCNGIGFVVTGSIFLPRHSQGTWLDRPGPGDTNFDIPSYDWWSVDGLVTSRISGAFELLAGLRFDHTSTRVDYADNTKDDYILNAYLPLIGAQVNQRSCNGALLVRFMGAPTAFGTLKYHFWTHTDYSESGDFDLKNSYLLEFLADYRRAIASNLMLGGFVRWNALAVRTDEQRLSGTNPDPNPVSWKVDVSSVVIGGSLSVGFSCPF